MPRDFARENVTLTQSSVVKSWPGVILLALKDKEDQDGPEAQAAIRKLKADFKKAFPV